MYVLCERERTSGSPTQASLLAGLIPGWFKGHTADLQAMKDLVASNPMGDADDIVMLIIQTLAVYDVKTETQPP